MQYAITKSYALRLFSEKNRNIIVLQTKADELWQKVKIGVIAVKSEFKENEPPETNGEDEESIQRRPAKISAASVVSILTAAAVLVLTLCLCQRTARLEKELITAQADTAAAFALAEFYEQTHNERNPLLEAELAEKSVTNASGGTVASYGEIKITKASLSLTTGEQLRDFVLQRVLRSKYAYTAVICEDGTGLVFSSGSCIAWYGQVGQNGQLDKIFGRVLLSESGAFSYLPNVPQAEETAAQSETAKPSPAQISETAQKESDEEAQTSREVAKEASETSCDEKSDSVYITKTGKKYHRSGCSSLSKSKIEIKRSDAVSRGYQPCRMCKP